MSLRRGVSWRARLRLKVFCVFIVSAFCVLGFMQKESLAVSIDGTGSFGSFEGTFTYSVADSSNAAIGVTLKNTTIVNY